MPEVRSQLCTLQKLYQEKTVPCWCRNWGRPLYDGLHLLKQAKLPAMLLEVAVITPPEDDKRVASPEYRRLVLDAITENMAKIP